MTTEDSGELHYHQAPQAMCTNASPLPATYKTLARYTRSLGMYHSHTMRKLFSCPNRAFNFRNDLSSLFLETLLSK